MDPRPAARSTAPQSARISGFVMCTPQPDNLGDVVLRRRMLRPFLQRGRCLVFVGSADDALVASLDIPAPHEVTRSFAVFARAAIAGVRAPDWFFGYDAGELTGNPKTVVWNLLVAPIALAGALRRRPRFRLGVGLRSTEGIWPALLRPLVRLASVTMWREPTGARFFGTGEVVADWGFDETSDDDAAPATAPTAVAPRDVAVVSMRGDRAAPGAVWVGAVRRLAAERGVRLQVVPQVRSDNARSRELADLLGAELLAWIDEDHVAREASVRERYRAAQFVVSDRLHALVMGFTEGAMPLGLMTHPDIKVARHFAAVGIDGVSVDVSDHTADDVVALARAVLDRSGELPAWRADAAGRVRRMDRAVLQ